MDSRPQEPQLGLVSRFFSALNFGRVSRIIGRLNNAAFEQHMHPPLPSGDQVATREAEFDGEFRRAGSLFGLMIRFFDLKTVGVLSMVGFSVVELGQTAIVYKLSDYIKSASPEHPPERTVLGLYFLGIMVTQYLNGLLMNHCFYQIGLKMVVLKNQFMLKIIKRVFQINLKATDQTSRGNVVNLIQVDCANIESDGPWALYAIYGIMTLFTTFAIGALLLGWAFWVYVGVFGILSGITTLGFRIAVNQERKLLMMKDQRISELTNILSNIRFVKFQAMEDFFTKVIHNIRARELHYVRWVMIAWSLVIFLNWLSPNASSSAMFASYFQFYGVPNTVTFLTAQQVQYLAQLIFVILPGSLVMVFKFIVMFGRMRKFFNIREYDTSFISNVSAQAEGPPNDNPYAIVLQDCDFTFTNEEQETFNKACGKEDKKPEEASDPKDPKETKGAGDAKDLKEDKERPEAPFKEDGTEEALLQPRQERPEGFEEDVQKPPQESPETNDTNTPKKEEKKAPSAFRLRVPELRIEKGKVVFVIGRIGSGKSALIQSLLGELAAGPNTRVQLDGSLTYCSQQPFLMTKTIRDNIAFYRPMDEERLERAVRMADLEPDIASFDDGLNKVLNEGAMNVSGGQRSRINMARCFYGEADIYLLDDPFSALDVHVACRIIENSVLRELHGKTRVIVTHSIQYLSYADTVIYIDHGAIGFQGTFEEFKTTSQFSDLQKTIAKEILGAEAPPALGQMNSQENKLESPKETELPNPKVGLRIDSLRRSFNSEENKRDQRKDRLEKDAEDSLLEVGNITEEPTMLNDTTLNPDAPPPPPTPKDNNDFIKKYFLEEDRNEGRQFRLFLKLIWRYYGGFKFIILLIGLCATPRVVFYFANVHLLEWIRAYEAGMPVPPAGPTILEYAIFMTTPSLLIMARLGIELYVAVKAARILHEKMMVRVLHGDLLGFFDKVDAGRIINRFSKDVATLDNDLSSTYGQFCVSVSIFLTNVLVIGINLTWFVWLAVSLFLCVLVYYQNEFVKVKKDVRRLDAVSKSPVVSLVSEIIQGRQVIRSFGCEESVLEEMRTKMNENTKNVVFRMALESWFNMKVLNYSVFLVQLFAFGYFLFLVDTRDMNEGFVLMLTYVFSFVEIITYASNNLSSLESNFVAVERCDAFNQIPLEHNYTHFDKQAAILRRRLPREKLKAFLRTKTPNVNDERFDYEQINAVGFNREIFTRGRIEFHGVWATYPLTERPALKNISLTVEPGMKLGVAGKTGSGKTSLIKLLTRYLRQDQGQVLVDGYDVGLMDLKQLRSEMLVISQEIALFEGTILENMNPEFIESKVKENKKKRKAAGTRNGLEEPLVLEGKSEGQVQLEAEITDCLTRFGFSKDKMAKEGLNFKVALGGENLSPGEQQLIAIFRALFTNKKIIILDEATASIDYETEKAITEFLYRKIKDKTMIAIAHRVNTIINCDQVLILDQGAIVEKGAPQALLANPNSRFGAMYRQINTNMELRKA